jgi:hypothetical protein
LVDVQAAKAAITTRNRVILRALSYTANRLAATIPILYLSYFQK